MAHDREAYLAYKSAGICVQCRRENAMEGRVCCPDCADKKTERNRRRDEKLRASPEFMEKERQRKKETRESRRQAGLCVSCGKRPPSRGRDSCIECLIYKRRTTHNLRFADGHIPKQQSLEFGLCGFCGKEPVMPGKGLCEKCYTKAVSILDYYHKNPTEKMLETRKYIKDRINLDMQPAVRRVF